MENKLYVPLVVGDTIETNDHIYGETILTITDVRRIEPQIDGVHEYAYQFNNSKEYLTVEDFTNIKLLDIEINHLLKLIGLSPKKIDESFEIFKKSIVLEVVHDN